MGIERLQRLGRVFAVAKKSVKRAIRRMQRWDGDRSAASTKLCLCIATNYGGRVGAFDLSGRRPAIDNGNNV